MTYCIFMPARLLRSSIALVTLLIELRYTLSQLTAHPLTGGFVPRFQALREQWAAVQAQEISLNEDLSDARAQIDIADLGLDDFATRFSHAVQGVTGQKRDDALYQHFFPIPLHELRRPVLGRQLKLMQDWLVSLASSPHPTLVAMLPELTTLVEAADQAAKRRDELTLRLRNFRDVGERRQLFDRVNAERKELHGALSKLALSTPGLSPAFANQFFKPGESEETTVETIDTVSAEIATLEESLTERRERLIELEREAADTAKEAEDRARKEARLAELKQEIAARQKELQALAGELE
jgi:hypothetical protein